MIDTLTRDNKNLSGIYQIRNLINNKLYIGSAFNFRLRKNSHFSTLNRGVHNSEYLQNSWNKYGKSNFIFEILEICDRSSILLKEQYYLDLLKPYNKNGFNMCMVAGNIAGFKHTEYTKSKISAAFKGIKKTAESIEKNRMSQLGKTYSVEVNKKKGLKGEKSPHFGKGKKVLQYSLDNIFLNEWNSGCEVERNIGIHQGGISECCNFKRETYKGFIWKFKNITNGI